MTTPGSTPAPKPREIRNSTIHLVIYSVLLVAYFLLVLRYLGAWLTDLFKHHRFEYALAGIIIMIVQAVVLEIISGWILLLIRGNKRR